MNKVRSEAMWRLGSQAARKPVNAAAAKIQSEKNNGNEKKGECTKTERMEHMMLTSNRATATWGERTNANRASVTLVFVCVDFTRKQYRNLEILDMHSFAGPSARQKPIEIWAIRCIPLVRKVVSSPSGRARVSCSRCTVSPKPT